MSDTTAPTTTVVVTPPKPEDRPQATQAAAGNRTAAPYSVGDTLKYGGVYGAAICLVDYFCGSLYHLPGWNNQLSVAACVIAFAAGHAVYSFASARLGSRNK